MDSCDAEPRHDVRDQKEDDKRLIDGDFLKEPSDDEVDDDDELPPLIQAITRQDLGVYETHGGH